MADADTKSPAPTVEIGYQVAVPSYNWWLYENETTPELQWPQSILVYDQMRRTDAQVASVLRAVEEVIIRTPWRIDPNGARDEVVQLVADDFGLPIVGSDPKAPARTKDKFSWLDHLRLALLMLPFGHAYFEQVYRVDDDGSRAHLRKLAYRPPTTIDCIDVASDGGLVSIKQRWSQADSEPRAIPVDRLVAYIHKREGGNWLGTSILRNCYKNWLLKDRLLRVQAQTIERNGMGVPLYKGAESETDLAAGLNMARAWRSGETAAAAVAFGADMVLRGVEGTLPDAEKVVRYHDEQIARAVLAHFLNLGTQTGSWALGSTFADFFTLSLQTTAQQIANITTMYVIEDLVDVNWGSSEPAPRLVFDEIGSRQAATAEALKSLVDAGILHPDEPLESAARQYYGLPPADPATARPAPGTDPLTGLDPAATATPEAEQPFGAESVAASSLDAMADRLVALVQARLEQPDGAGTPEAWIAAAAGVDTHPGGEELKRWWVFGPGAAKWATWTELYEHLRKYIENTHLLKATVSAWYKLRYGHMPPHHGVHASADVEPDDEADDWDMAIDALCAALDELSGAVAAAFNPRQARNPKGSPGGGRFRSMVETLKDAIEHHRTTGAAGHPFASFDREQLRRVARKRGIELKRGEDRDSIAAKLLEDLRPSNSRADKLAERQSKAGQKAAGIGVREESPKQRARRERIEQLTNEALDERARQDAEQEAADAAQPASVELPKMKGSSKQREWAERIRQRALDSIAGYEPGRIGRNASGRQAEDEIYRRIASGHLDAKWWIDNRNDILRRLRGEVSEGDRKAVRLHEDAGFGRGESPLGPGGTAVPDRVSERPPLPSVERGPRPQPVPQTRQPVRLADLSALSDTDLRERYRAAVDLSAQTAEEDLTAKQLRELRSVAAEMQRRGLLAERQKPVRRFGRLA